MNYNNKTKKMEKYKEITYINENIGTEKASIFLIGGFWYWIPRSLIYSINYKENKIKVPIWFYKKMKPDFNYIY